MKIYLIRHGEDDSSFRGGWSNLGLTENGIIQSKELAKKLKNFYNINKIISSDLIRAKQTANIINSELNVEIEYTDKLREMNNGLLAGMKNDVAERKFPGIYFNTLDMNEKFPGGESPAEFYERIVNGFNCIVNENANIDNLALVTHGGVIGIIYAYVNRLEWSNKNKIIKVGCCEIIEIERW